MMRRADELTKQAVSGVHNPPKQAYNLAKKAFMGSWIDTLQKIDFPFRAKSKSMQSAVLCNI